MNENNWKWKDQKINITPPIVGGHWTEDSYEYCKICPNRITSCSIHRCPAIKRPIMKGDVNV